MSKIKIVVYQDDKIFFQKECSSYLMATRGEEKNIGCSIVAQSEKNMRQLVAACMASALGILEGKGVTEEDINEFFKRAFSEMFSSEPAKYEEARINEPLQ